MQISVQWIAVVVSGRLVRNDVFVTGPVMTDSCEAQAGPFYVVRHDRSADGHAFVFSAATRGAVVVIVEHKVDKAVTQIVIGDSTEVLGLLARAHIEKLRNGGDLDVIVMTGSVGKTTMKDLLLQIMSEDGPTIAPKLFLNNEIGLPLTVLLAGKTTRHLVLEVNASEPSHITHLTDIVVPDVAIELCIGHAYVGDFGGFEGVAATKAELIKGTRPGGPVILNMDDPNVETMASLTTERVIRFSASGSRRADAVVRNMRLGRAGCVSLILVAPGGETPIELKTMDRHHIASALAAAAGALTPGVGPETVASILSCTRVLNLHRMGVYELRIDGANLTLIDGSYNVNPDSMRTGIAALAPTGCNNQHIAVLDEMFEPGKDSQSPHQQADALIVDVGVDILVGPGADIHYYLKGAPEVSHRGVTADPQNVAWLVLEHAKDGAVVLVKGSFSSQSWWVTGILREKGTTQ